MKRAVYRSPFSLGLLIAAGCCVALCSTASAVAPSLSRLTPWGGQRGTEVPVTFSGGALSDAADVVFHAAGITFKDLTVVDDGNVTVTLVIAPDCPVGTQPLRLHTRTGISNILLFSVGALKEIQETEPNNPVASAAPLEMNTTVNGVIPSEDVDFYSVALEAGQRLAVEVEGLRLGRVLFDPKLRFFDPAGHEVIAEDDTQLLRQDAGFTYVAKEAGAHTIAVSEASYGGNGDCLYRLHVGSFPRPLAMTPMGAAPGATVHVTWLGDPALSAQDIVVPAVDTGTRPLAVQTDLGVAPSDMPFRVSSFAGVSETEPNNDPATASAGAVAGAFDGVIGEPGDIDYFSFPGVNGNVWDVRVWARALGSPLDSVLRVKAPSGGEVASDDDSAGIDSALRLTLGEDGNYVFSVQDHLDRGGPGFTYRVEFTPVAPGLSTKTLENRPASLTVPQNNQSYLLVNVARRDFDGPVKIEMLDLPAGLTAASDVLPAGQTVLPVLVTATPDAPMAAALARLHGVQDVPENPIQGDLDQEVVMVYGLNESTFYGIQVNRLALAVSEPAPFKIEIVPPAAPIVQGGARMLTVNATRAEGFTAPIDLRFAWLPTGMGGGTAQIPGDQTSVQIRLEVRRDAAVGVQNLFVAANAGGFQLCSPFTPVEVQEPWMELQLAAVETDQGKPVEMVVGVTHRAPFEGSFPVTLGGLPKNVTTEPQQVTKDTTELRFPIAVAADSPAGKFEGLFTQTDVVVNNEGVTHVNGGGALTIFEPLPAALQAAAPPPAPAAETAEPAPARKTRFPTS